MSYAPLVYMPTPREHRALDPVSTPIGENEVAGGAPQVERQRVWISITDDVNPHVDAIVTHRTRQDDVELFPLNQIHQIGAGTGLLRRCVEGRGETCEQY